ncbi:Ig-like domain-containing protein [Luminiphilus sp.]|jgi:hypothetical protein|nr:Ig-like domain-containing protein [Luminiphilus sp.]
MRRTIAAIALSLLSAGAFAGLIFEHKGHTYKLVESPASWDEATANAADMSLGEEAGYLARIDSAAENKAIVSALSTHLSPAQLANTIPNDVSEAPFIWLGGSDEDQEGQWLWSNNGDPFWRGNFNGKPVAGRYTNWGVQPDNAGGAENALAMGLANWPAPFYDLGITGQWNDLEADNLLLYLVEFDTIVDPLRASLDEPRNNGVHSGVGMIHGWALSSEGVERIEVFIDGDYAFDVPYGDPRADVGKAFPDINGASTSGFSVPFRYSTLSAGQHTVSVVVTDEFGAQVERSSTFEVVRFDMAYLNKANTPKLDWSYVSGFSDFITVRSAQVGDQAYDLVLAWQTQTQTFEIVEIIRVD